MYSGDADRTYSQYPVGAKNFENRDTSDVGDFDAGSRGFTWLWNRVERGIASARRQQGFVKLLRFDAGNGD